MRVIKPQKVAINEARNLGIEPTLAVSAFEYGETMTVLLRRYPNILMRK